MLSVCGAALDAQSRVHRAAEKVDDEIEQDEHERDEGNHRHHGEGLQDTAKNEGEQAGVGACRRRPASSADSRGAGRAPMMPKHPWSVNVVQ